MSLTDLAQQHLLVIDTGPASGSGAPTLPEGLADNRTVSRWRMVRAGTALLHDKLGGNQDLVALIGGGAGEADHRMLYVARDRMLDSMTEMTGAGAGEVIVALTFGGDGTVPGDILHALAHPARRIGAIVLVSAPGRQDAMAPALGMLAHGWQAADWIEDRATGHVVLTPRRAGATPAEPAATIVPVAGRQGAGTRVQVAVQNSDEALAGFAIVSARLIDQQVEGIVSAAPGARDGALPSVMALHEDAAVAVCPLTPDPAEPSRLRFVLDLPRAIYFDAARSGITLRLGLPTLADDDTGTRIDLPRRRVISAERLLDFDMTERPGDTAPLLPRRKPLGIVVYTFTRTDAAMQVLESLRRQEALDLVEVWMDGDQGKPAVRKALDESEKRIRAFGVDRVTRHRGNLGFRKLILQSLSHMVRSYDRFIVLEDDCFPTRDAVAEFIAALDRHQDDEDVLTTYGHHFLVPAEQDTCPRFQGWGWATWSDRFQPFLNELIYLFSLPEAEFVAWAEQAMTPEILARIDATAPRDASKTLRNFFAWDEALTLVSALAGKVHAPTARRCIYNFGVGADSTHFTNIDWYRKPPFNMVLREEIWDQF